MLSLLSTLVPPSTSRAWFTAAHPDLPVIATCLSDKSVRIYSISTFTFLSTISGGHKRSVRTCSWKPNLKTESVLATGSFDASVGIWKNSKIASKGEAIDRNNYQDLDDEEDWHFAIVLEGHESEVKSVAWSAGGNFIATCSRDKSVWIWEEVAEDDFETIAVLQEHEGDVKCVAWHPEEELLASGSYDNEIRLWKEEVDDWGCVEILRGHSSTVWAVAWELNASSARLVSCSDDMTIRIWKQSETWIEEARLPHTHERAIYSVAWSKSGKIVSIGGDGRLVVYEEKPTNNADRGQGNGNKGSLADQTDEISAVELSTQVKTEWVVAAEFENAHGVFEVNHVCWARRGNSEVIVTTGDDGTVKIWTC